jgi:hypothetical protein
MTGSIGVDLQRSRAAVCLTEWANGRARQGPVGDGSRILVPVAATETAWGSPAAEAVLAAQPAGRPPASLLYAWRQDPWGGPFLTGLHRRLLGFLGQVQPEGLRSHRLFVCADPESAADWAAADELLNQAGLPGTELVRPADALVCRWLSQTPEPPSGTVLAVACGEVATIIGRYSVSGAGAVRVGRAGETRVEGGSGPWVIEMARDALGHCRPGFPARALLGLLDGVDEFAAMVRTSRDDTWVEWAGPLSQHMFEPLRASRPELARRATVTDFTRPVASAVHAALRQAGRRVTLLVGGPGAAWPFVADALAGIGTVWQSGDPTLDLAYGACWWDVYQRGFERGGPEAGPAWDSEPAGADQDVPPEFSPEVAPPAVSGPAAPGPVSAGLFPESAEEQADEQDADLPWEKAPGPAGTAAPEDLPAAPAGEEFAADDEPYPWEL